MAKAKKKREARELAPVEPISTLKDLLRWLVVHEQLEEEERIPEPQRIAHRWTIFPFEGSIYVGIATGLSGQEILNRYPELDVPISLPAEDELPEELRRLGYPVHIFYLGPFNQELNNLV
ncbi:MAG: hypothetical protein NZ610_01330 [Candidatus Bipolaricaulota bacterium]|nr:hypothetical protein [Candidatus Bipolaricaulota bacterium]MCS7274035.1 hypothetical protein [Candidatus Bipolaricaulota bacterium]MDW8110235.1 hypothetical protein [Candidatus Bipolaricaulota bacterium]MDW8328865.1 hypothetical protein [Candidatus Bipolaricaulota bacterium]